MTAEGERASPGAGVYRTGVARLGGRRWRGAPPANDNHPPRPSPLARTLALILLAVAVAAALWR